MQTETIVEVAAGIVYLSHAVEFPSDRHVAARIFATRIKDMGAPVLGRNEAWMPTVKFDDSEDSSRGPGRKLHAVRCHRLNAQTGNPTLSQVQPCA